MSFFASNYLITVNDSAPTLLSYNSPNVFTKDVAISPLSPSVSGGAVVSYSITPTLPLGLSLNTTTGIISGTPSVISSSAGTLLRHGGRRGGVGGRLRAGCHRVDRVDVGSGVRVLGVHVVVGFDRWRRYGSAEPGRGLLN